MAHEVNSSYNPFSDLSQAAAEGLRATEAPKQVVCSQYCNEPKIRMFSLTFLSR